MWLGAATVDRVGLGHSSEDHAPGTRLITQIAPCASCPRTEHICNTAALTELTQVAFGGAPVAWPRETGTTHTSKG